MMTPISSEKSEDDILEELLKFNSISTTRIQIKYHVSYQCALKIRHRWEDKQPKEPTMEERMEVFRKNPTFPKSPPKKRKASFFINGKMLHSWEEAEKELSEIKRIKAC